LKNNKEKAKALATGNWQLATGNQKAKSEKPPHKMCSINNSTHNTQRQKGYTVTRATPVDIQTPLPTLAAQSTPAAQPAWTAALSPTLSP